jgi:hypothetical protein
MKFAAMNKKYLSALQVVKGNHGQEGGAGEGRLKMGCFGLVLVYNILRIQIPTRR